MNKFFRALIAGYGAKKLGGGCFSTILIFFLIYYLLGTCNRSGEPARQGKHMSQPVVKQPQTAAVKF